MTPTEVSPIVLIASQRAIPPREVGSVVLYPESGNGWAESRVGEMKCSRFPPAFSAGVQIPGYPCAGTWFLDAMFATGRAGRRSALSRAVRL